eukprot:UN04393
MIRFFFKNWNDYFFKHFFYPYNHSYDYQNRVDYLFVVVVVAFLDNHDLSFDYVNVAYVVVLTYIVFVFSLALQLQLVNIIVVH